MINIDLSKFKKLEDSDKHAVLLHENGHKMTIAKNAISEKLRKQLDDLPTNLAKGGYAKFSQKFDPNMGSKASKPSKPSNTMPDMNIGKEAKNTYSEPNDQGGNDIVLKSLNRKAPPYGVMGSEQQHYPPCVNPSCKSFGKSHPNCRCYGGNPEGKESHLFAEGGAVEKEYYCDDNRAHKKGCEYYKGGSVQKFKDKGEVEPESDSQKLAEADDIAKQDLTNQQYGPETIPPPSPGGQDVSSSQPDLVPNPEAQNNTSAAPAPQADTSNQPAPNPLEGNPNFGDNYEAPGRDPYIDYQQNVTNNMLTHAQRYQDDLDAGKIQQQHYFHLFSGDKDAEGKPTALAKIGSVFGLMLSGIGSGLTGQPNAALAIMNNEINNDMKRQELSSQNQQNFLRINQQGLMNDATIRKMNVDTGQAAKLLSLSNQRRSALHYLVDKTQRMPESTPLQKQQKAAANQTLMLMNTQIQSEDNDMFTKFGAAQAAQQAMFGTPGQGQGPNTTMMKSFGPPEVQKLGTEIEQKSLPGEPSVAGQMARKPLNQNDVDQVNNMNILDSKMKDLIQYAGKNVGTLSPSERARAQQKANEAVGFYSNSLGTSMTEGNRTWLDDQVAKKNPTSAISQILLGSQSKLKEIQESNLMRKNMLLQKMGFSPKQASQNKPARVIQNGHTYNLNPQTGNYE